ncbi:MAG: hypothetical protein EOO13_14765 [Chitinophagaceae bacterium]|nr:MAG: hypothetical protein EOO13_14765 [Chitinophagaceae bacterium]
MNKRKASPPSMGQYTGGSSGFCGVLQGSVGGSKSVSNGWGGVVKGSEGPNCAFVLLNGTLTQNEKKPNSSILFSALIPSLIKSQI